MRCTLSACADADAFASFALSCARQGADLLLCHPDSGHADTAHADSGMGDAPYAGAAPSGQPSGTADATDATGAPHIHTAMPPGWTVWPGGEGQGPCCLVGIGPREELCPGDPAPGSASNPAFGLAPPRRASSPDHEPGPHTDAALAAFLGLPTPFGAHSTAPQRDGAPLLWQPARADHDIALGFLAYTYGLPRFGIRSAKPRVLPHALLRRYHAVARWNPATGALTLSVHPDAPPDMAARCARLLGDAPASVLATPGGHAAFTAPSDCAALPPSLDRAGYTAGVREVLRRIRAGDTYQCNLSTRFGLHAPGLHAPGLDSAGLDPAALSLHLWRTRPAPFHGLFRIGGRLVVSASPERFLRVDAPGGGPGRVLSQPIKGTLAFGPDTPHPLWHPGLPGLLAATPKERAELSMIVDLVRNDISADCAHGSVAVARHCATFRVGGAASGLVQMYSDVTGTLRPDRTCLDLLLSAFPGGSVTGCPKRRTLAIIEAGEPHSREVYCGSLLAIADARTMDASIAIRTGWHDAATGRFEHCAGSGIVVDSDPESEYEETWAKAANFREVCA
ncbi:chorismate-binding protein [Nitratidesulfovibrio liaohensis]|uniref:Chorismate-binding protein n=1 Tax=Nitratidesulfovibrio liaohensis TaxID=2604158 RepID=A0ABY9QZ67_9BACT|nr:chorismate-binding protein [Nitratidesulfovibrio liaohensis]WMW64637.1 chorismate-binding protein [Nitratidesulfovibrio liaohensis]